jgi:putative DNA primase/helicase
VFFDKTTNVARGKWRGILLQLGLPETALRNRHGPCPICGGTDRFRFDDTEGRGTWICNQCGAGDGMALAQKYTGKGFPEVAAMIDGMVGNIKFEAARAERTADETRDLLRDTWRATVPVQPGDLAHRYLASRGVEEMLYPAALRFAARLRDGEGGVRPCMVAMVGVAGQDKPVSMHRTFLKPDGSGKAEMAAPRKLMPGTLPDGACVMLSDYSGGPLVIAEGIETAMSASALYDMPVWAALNAPMLRKWTPPDGCDEVAIFGDNDANFAGQAAAYGLPPEAALRAPVQHQTRKEFTACLRRCRSSARGAGPYRKAA